MTYQEIEQAAAGLAQEANIEFVPSLPARHQLIVQSQIANAIATKMLSLVFQAYEEAARKTEEGCIYRQPCGECDECRQAAAIRALPDSLPGSSLFRLAEATSKLRDNLAAAFRGQNEGSQT